MMQGDEGKGPGHEPTQYPGGSSGATPAPTPVITIGNNNDDNGNDGTGGTGNGRPRSSSAVFVAKLQSRTSILLDQAKQRLVQMKDWGERSSRDLVESTSRVSRDVVDRTSRVSRDVVDRTARGSRGLSLSTKAAALKAMANAKRALDEIGSVPLEEETTDDDTDDVDTNLPPKIKGAETDKWITFFPVGVVPAVALLGFFSGFSAFVIVVGHIADLASAILFLLISPLILVQRRKLSKLGSFRKLHNETRSKVNRIHQQNIQLTESINALETHVQSLDTISDELDAVAKKSEASVEDLVKIVHETWDVQTQIKTILMEDIMQDVLTTLLQSDRDQNFTVSKTEVEMMTLRLQNMPGIVFHPDRFQNFLESDEGLLTLKDVCALARRMQNAEKDKIPEDQRIVTLRPDSILAASKKKQQEDEGNKGSAAQGQQEEGKDSQWENVQ